MTGDMMTQEIPQQADPTAEPEADSPPAKSRGAWQEPTFLVLATLNGVGIPAACLGMGNVWPVMAAPVLSVGMWLVHRASLVNQTRALDEARHELNSQSVRDEETGCHNRAGLFMLGEPIMETVRRRGDAVHAFIADTSHVTSGGNTLTPAQNTLVMKAVAAALRASVRGTDVVCRWDNSQFVILGPGTGVHPGELERRVRTHLSENSKVPVDDWPCRITVGQSSLAPWDGGDIHLLIEKAEKDFIMRKSMRSPTAPDSFFARGTAKKPGA